MVTSSRIGQPRCFSLATSFGPCFSKTLFGFGLGQAGGRGFELPQHLAGVFGGGLGQLRRNADRRRLALGQRCDPTRAVFQEVLGEHGRK